MPKPHQISAPQPLDMLWRPDSLIWIIMTGEALAMALSLAPGISADRLILFGLNSLAIQWTALLCLGLLYLGRIQLQKYQPSTVALAALCALLAATATTYLLLWLLLGKTTVGPREDWAQLLFHMVALALIFGLLGVAAFQNHWRIRLLAIQAKQAELDTLRARVNPHFLFNALNSAVSLVRHDPASSERLLTDLADLFRAALSRSDTVSLSHELELCRQYLDIEALRFGDRFKLQWQVPSPLPDLRLPCLSLQPLMENAIRHGLEPRVDGGEICVIVECYDSWIEITIQNPMPPPGSPKSTGHQLGLKSIRSRLDTHFEGRAVLETSTANGSYQTKVRLPLG